jgi:hypothetical protein
MGVDVVGSRRTLTVTLMACWKKVSCRDRQVMVGSPLSAPVTGISSARLPSVMSALTAKREGSLDHVTATPEYAPHCVAVLGDPVVGMDRIE